ncbi:hypothetical protein PUN28_010979 [Cardiocondyla obscurior]|uniref:Uncharacterized protein n=1 Tax=Cardiocondyla obscurior TaxID=286306 RepID=A0AAW2FK46_9HYME
MLNSTVMRISLYSGIYLNLRRVGRVISVDQSGGISKERELGPKLGCNYSRLPCKLPSCHSYLARWIQLR